MQHKKSTTITRFLSIILALSFTANNVFAGEAEGKVLYQSKCQRCHLVDKKLTGPALQNVRTRWADSTNLYAWIKNSQSFLGTGDKYANDLYKEYNSIMPVFVKEKWKAGDMRKQNVNKIWLQHPALVVL